VGNVEPDEQNSNLTFNQTCNWDHSNMGTCTVSSQMFIAICFELHRGNPKTSSHKSLWNGGKWVSKNEYEKIIIINKILKFVKR
jgi:hypothetical protein